jgi:hypothetical protein
MWHECISGTRTNACVPRSRTASVWMSRTVGVYSTVNMNVSIRVIILLRRRLRSVTNGVTVIWPESIQNMIHCRKNVLGKEHRVQLLFVREIMTANIITLFSSFVVVVNLPNSRHPEGSHDFVRSPTTASILSFTYNTQTGLCEHHPATGCSQRPTQNAFQSVSACAHACGNCGCKD